MSARLVRRFVVDDDSMTPALVDGQGLIGVRSKRAKPGQIRCLEQPDRRNFWLVKRVVEVHDGATMTVMSDNRSVPTTDSRRFGPVPVAGTYRVVVKLPRRWM